MAHEVHFTKEQLTERFVFTRKLKNIVFGLIGVGAVLVVAGLIVANLTWHGESHGVEGEGHAVIMEQPASPGLVHPVSDPPEGGEEAHAEGGHAHHSLAWYTRALANFLVSNLFFLTLAMGALFFIAVHRVGNAGWQTAIKRVPEAMTLWLPAAIVGFALMIVVAPSLYDWLALHVGEDHLIDEKRAYLNYPFWIVRFVIFFGGWFATAYILRKLSVEQDLAPEGELSQFKKMVVVSAVFIIFFALSYTLFSIDWIKSLEPHWFSTIFGVYVFAGSMASTMAAMGLILYFLKRQGYMSYVNDAHFHDIYKYAFGFSVFWGYIFVSQFLLIWYANIPEETFYYVKRMATGYGTLGTYLGYRWVFWTVVLLCFFVPFFGFMTRNAKRNPKTFVPLAILMLIGHWLDLYMMVMPGAVRGEWGFGLQELGFMVLLLGVFLYVVFNSLSKANLTPINHPYLDESLHHTTGPV